MPLTQSQRNRTEETSPDFSAGRKLSEMEQALLWSVLQEEPECPSRVLLDKAAERQIVMTVSLRHVNRWRLTWGLNRGKGRPRQTAGSQPVACGSEIVRVTPHVLCVGVHVFAQWLDHRDAFGPVVAPHEHPLKTLLGRGYQSSTLSQFLGQLERVGADETLLPALVAEQAGQIIYVDGHMIAYWSRRSMHKGKITMSGRIMSGSQAVIAHDDGGQAVFVAYYPPDIHVSQVIVAYCQQVALATGRALFVIDRAVNAVALAQAFDEKELGLLCMLDDNEHAGLESFEATVVDTLKDGTRVYSGPWKESRQDDPRHFVIVDPPEDKLLVYWGTPQLQDALEAREWPRVYRERNAMQELSFKGMIDHGGLDINYGRKTILGPDRHHQRKQAQLAQSLETAHERVDKKAEAVTAQQAKVAESEAKGHGRRLEQRQGTLVTLEHELKDAQGKQAKLSEQAATLGPAGQRADRDFRKQTIMTIRTLLLENMLRAFLAALLATLSIQVSLEQVLSLLFERHGAHMETPSQVVYWVNTAGLSQSNRRLLGKIVEGLGTMDLQDQGKPIHVRLKDMPP